MNTLKLSVEPMRRFYPDDRLIQEWCDLIESSLLLEDELVQVFAKVGIKAKGWHVTDFALEQHFGEPPRLRIEMIKI